MATANRASSPIEILAADDPYRGLPRPPPNSIRLANSYIVNVGTPMARPGYFWDATSMHAKITIIECVTHGQNGAQQELQRVMNDFVQQCPVPVNAPVGVD
jgi:hypothetical protein